MKPLKLSIQAFGPYLKKTVIDFTKLYKNGLFLITGPTGCGKTTILDATSFALYGAASGEVRNVKDMRSAQAPDELDTEVIYEMQLGKDFYKFERTNKIKIVKKRNGDTEKTIVNIENCYIKKDDEWKLLCEGTAVTAKAKELLGFSHEQFSQVVVLPQGEFRKLLTESSLEKQKILEELFGTQRWQTFTLNLAKRAKDLKTELEKCSDKTTTLVESTGCENYEAVLTLFDETKKELEKAEKEFLGLNEDFKKKDALLKASEESEKKFLELDETEKKLEDLKNKKDTIEEQRAKLLLSDKAKNFMPYLSALGAAKLNFESAKKSLLESTVALGNAKSEEAKAAKLGEEAKTLAPKLEELSKETAKSNLVLASFKALKEAETAIAELSKNFDEASKKAAAATDEVKAKTENVKTLRENLNVLSDKYISSLPDLTAQQTQLQVIEQKYSDLAELEKSLQKNSKELEKEREEYKKAHQNYLNNKKILDEMTVSFDSDSAYKLSENLKDGCACPVCGATSHPSPAKKAEGAPSADELDTQKKLVADLEKDEQNMISKGLQVKAEHDSLKKQIDSLKADCEKDGLTAEKLKARKEAVDKSVALGKKATQKQKEGQSQLKTLEENLSKETEISDTLEKEKNKLSENLAAAKAKAVELKKNVPEEFKGTDEVEEKILDLKNEFEKLSKKSDEAANAQRTAESNLAAASERLKAVKENVANSRKAKDTAKEDYDKKFAEFFSDVDKTLVADDTKIKSLVIVEEEAEKARDDVKNYDNALLVASQREKALKAELLKAKRPETENIRRDRDEAFSALQELLQKKTTLNNNIENLSKVKTELDKTAKREEKLSKDYALYSRMFNFASGKNPQKTPIHQFILGIMLQDIVTSANIHLQKLSRSRYTLVRSSEASRGGGTKGLELSVNDAWSGGERSVSTLSGGEMFLASLSLAFGLSDVVQSYSGGIRLDSLFIDEGFGSLDSETLEISMNALESLRSSGRLIGIISHVSELSQRIHDKISVSRKPDGTATALVETED